MVFAHANGFPVKSYKPLLDPLNESFQIAGWEARPLVQGTDPRNISGWRDLAEDLRLGIEDRFSSPVIGTGHSLGGVLHLMTAVANPELYRALVLLDPVIFTGARSVIWGQMKRWGRAHRLPLMAGALRRRDAWPDRETVRRSWAGKPAFEGWTDAAFDAYLEAGLEEDSGSKGVRLRYPKAWEARIFEVSPHDVWPEISKLQVPVLVLVGEHSDTFTAGAARRFERKAPDGVCRIVKGTGHMLPMQRPEVVAQKIKDWLAESTASI
ncbi:MAG: alpha/beta hydrolase [Acidobacteriota bacterium]